MSFWAEAIRLPGTGRTALRLSYLRSAVGTALLAAFCLLAPSREATAQWTATWGSAQMQAAPATLIRADFANATLRQVVHVSIGGTSSRVHVSNAFGAGPLLLRSVSVAAPGKTPGSIAGRPVAVLFNGRASVEVPGGAEYLSDPVSVSVAELSDIAVTMLVQDAPAVITSHPGARATSFLLRGDHAKEAELKGARSFPQWYFLAGIDVRGDKPSSGAVVAFGDSITDGHGATTDGNDRWTDVLAQRLSNVGVVNRGIGGNRMLEDGLGPNALARFDRDVLTTAGVRFVVLLEGINDLGTLDRVIAHTPEEHQALVQRLKGAYRQLAERAHAQGIRVYCGTVMPDRRSEYYHPSDASEADRQAINQWIRSSGTFEQVIDFDKLMRDPQQPDRLLPAYDSGDHLHPGPVGYAAMGEAVAKALAYR